MACVAGDLADKLHARCGLQRFGKNHLMICTFCRMNRDYVAMGPGVAICESCITEISSTLHAVEGRGTCSFCGKQERQSRFAFRNRRIVGISATGDTRICSDCLPIAVTVLDHNRSTSLNERTG